MRHLIRSIALCKDAGMSRCSCVSRTAMKKKNENLKKKKNVQNGQMAYLKYGFDIVHVKLRDQCTCSLITAPLVAA